MKKCYVELLLVNMLGLTIILWEYCGQFSCSLL